MLNRVFYRLKGKLSLETMHGKLTTPMRMTMMLSKRDSDHCFSLIVIRVGKTLDERMKEYSGEIHDEARQ